MEESTGGPERAVVKVGVPTCSELLVALLETGLRDVASTDRHPLAAKAHTKMARAGRMAALDRYPVRSHARNGR